MRDYKCGRKYTRMAAESLTKHLQTLRELTTITGKIYDRALDDPIYITWKFKKQLSLLAELTRLSLTAVHHTVKRCVSVLKLYCSPHKTRLGNFLSVIELNYSWRNCSVLGLE